MATTPVSPVTCTGVAGLSSSRLRVGRFRCIPSPDRAVAFDRDGGASPADTRNHARQSRHLYRRRTISKRTVAKLTSCAPTPRLFVA
jgi:hypothetical protein